MPQKVSFGFTIPQRGVFFGIATWPEMLAMAREADRISLKGKGAARLFEDRQSFADCTIAP